MNPCNTPRSDARARIALTAAIVTIALLAAACSGDSATVKKPVATTSSAAVTIDTFMFNPKVLHVHIGDTVTWMNQDSILHTVTSGMRKYEPGNGGNVTATHKDGAFDMPLDGRGSSATHTFTQAGTFHYFCDRHPGMEADIDVS